MSFAERLLHSFPVPAAIAMPAAGIDISDHSVKFIEFSDTRHGLRVGRFATEQIPDGIIAGGTIVRRDELAALLSTFRKRHKLTFVRASLPEEPGYIFTTKVPDVSPDEIRSLLKFKLEEHVPIAPSEAVVDYDVIAPASSLSAEHIVAVSVFPEAIAQEYADLLRASGLTPVSLEIEAQAIARAVVPEGSRDTRMVVDIGRMRSGLSVVSGRTVRFTATVETGGDELSRAIAAALPGATEEELLRIKNEEGMAHTAHPEVTSAMEQFAALLCSHIERYYLYWQTHKDKEGQKDAAAIPAQAIRTIVLSGGYANIAGLPEYIEHRLRVKTQRANAWVNAFSIDEYVPPISYRESLGYASAIGLALHRDDV